MTVTQLTGAPRRTLLAASITVRIADLLGTYMAREKLPAVLALLEPHLSPTPVGPDVQTWIPSDVAIGLHRILPAWPAGLAHAVLEAARPWFRAETPPARVQTGAGDLSDPALTAQEIAVLVRFAAGMETAEVGDDLGLTDDMIKGYSTKILRKFGVKNRAAAIHRGHSLGYLAADEPGAVSA